jgi:DNA polymerase I
MIIKGIAKVKYTNEGLLYLIRDDETGSEIWNPAKVERYFFIKKENSDLVKGISGVERVISGKIYSKVFYFGKWKDIVSKLEDKGIQTFEADVSQDRRLLIDNDIEFAKPKLLYYDIEVDDSIKYTDKTLKRVLSIAYSDGKNSGCLILEKDTDECEKEMIHKFIMIARRYDVLVGWNSSEFDEPVLVAKSIKYFGNNFMYDNGIRGLDMMMVFDKYWSKGADVKKSLALNNISKEILGDTKEDLGGQSISSLWKNNCELMEKYNRKDVELLVRIEEKTNFIEGANVLANICNSFLETKSLKANYLVDGYLLKLGAKHLVKFKTRPIHTKEQDDIEIKGAYCENFTNGYLENLDLYDFKSLYPSIIMSFNISPETKVGDDYKGDVYVTATGIKYRKDIEGVYSIMERTALEMRNKYKKEGKTMIANAWKILANSLAGVNALPFSRFYDVDIFESITQSGVKLITTVIDKAKKMGLKLVFSDTDSIAVVRDEKSSILGDKNFLDEVVKELFNIENKYFDLKYEGKFDKIIITTKKRYIAKRDNETIVKGLEIVRTDTCKLARDLQMEVCNLIFEGKKDEVLKRINEVRDLCYSYKLNKDDLAIYKKITKEQYKSDLVHTKLAKVLKERGQEVYLGMKIGYIIVESKPKLEGVLLDDFNGKYDSEYYWENLIYPPVQRILEVVYTDNEFDKKEDKKRRRKVEVEDKEDGKDIKQLDLLKDDKKDDKGGGKEIGIAEDISKKDAGNIVDIENNNVDIEINIDGLGLRLIKANILDFTGKSVEDIKKVKDLLDRYKDNDNGMELFLKIDNVYLVCGDRYKLNFKSSEPKGSKA